MEIDDVVMEDIISSATEKYAGRYFLSENLKEYSPTILKIKRFEKGDEELGMCVIGDYFWYCIAGRCVHIERDKHFYLSNIPIFSISILLASLEEKYTEISKEEFQKHKDFAVKNFIEGL